MNLDRNWTSFALDAEVEAFGTSRIASAHNKLRAEVAALNQPVKLSEWQELVAERDRLRAENDWFRKANNIRDAEDEATIKALKAERDRLRELLREALDAWTGDGPPIDLDRIRAAIGGKGEGAK